MAKASTQTPIEQVTPAHRTVYLAGSFMVLFLLTGFVMTLFAPTIFKSPEDKMLATGEWSATYEAALNKNLPVRQVGVDTWGVLEYTLFKNGRDGVLVGNDGWLFTSEEFKNYPDGEKAIEEKLELASLAQATLAEQGISLVVALIPSKARIYSEQLGRYPFPSYNQNLYPTFTEQLGSRGITAVNLLEPLTAAKIEQDVFLKTDTHWTPYGAEVVAKAIAKVVAENNLLPSLNTATFETIQTDKLTKHEGDLLNYLPLGVLQERIGPAFDEIAKSTTELLASDSSGGLFGSSTIPVTLVGTSYSANPLWNFEGVLKEALGADVLNVANQGEGPVVPMREYLESDALKDAPPELVIWEIPERFLRVSYASTGK
jgi:alginate O-acetyltransferase complex protein AlgJ